MADPICQQEAPGSSATDEELTDATTNVGLAASCRFEFETAKGNEGTKILMVEWEATQPSNSAHGREDREDRDGEEQRDDRPNHAWDVSWAGKSSTFPIRDRDVGTRKRVYFLLPPGVHVPRVVTITSSAGITLTTKPLPAIYPEGMAADRGSRGVLHTIWARKRLNEVDDEIAVEKLNCHGETVGLEMAFKEKRWLAQHFGLESGSRHDDRRGAGPVLSPVPLPGPLSPRSPATGKLGEKLKGLKLATSPSDLTGSAASDLAVPSHSGMPRPDPSPGDKADKEDELFALPMSPRSPDMERSPFSSL